MQEYGLLADDDVVHRDEHQFDHEADETHDGKTHGASDGDFLEPCSDKFLSRSTENIFCQNTISLYPKPTSFGFKIETRFWTIINVVNNNLKLSNHQMIVNVTWKCFLATLWRQAWCTSARGASKRR